MVRKFMIAATSSIAVLAVSATAFAQQYGAPPTKRGPC